MNGAPRKFYDYIKLTRDAIFVAKKFRYTQIKDMNAPIKQLTNRSRLTG